MGEAPNMYLNLNNQQQFRLNKISEIENYFIAEIRERELMSTRLSKYIASLDYFDKSLIVLSATSGGISIASFDYFDKSLIVLSATVVLFLLYHSLLLLVFL